MPPLHHYSALICALACLHIAHAASTFSNATTFLTRPNLYFGLRTRSPLSLLTGLIWFGVHDYPNVSKQRHSCEQNDGVTAYNWVKHDGRTAGIQVIDDRDNNVRLTTSFLKTPGGENGGSWAVRIQGQPIDGARLSRVSLIHYFALQSEGSLEIDTADEDEDGLEKTVKISGNTAELGDFDIRFVEGRGTSPMSRGRHADDFGERIDRFQYLALKLPEGQAWRAKDYIIGEGGKEAQTLFEKYGQESMPDPAVLILLPNDVRFGANSIAVQRSFEGSFELDIFFDSKSLNSPPMDSFALSAGLEAFSAAYDARFENTFHLAAKDYNEREVDFARQMTSSLVGGIGYFHGSSIVDRSFAFDYDDPNVLSGEERTRQADPRLTEPKELFTATPSRPFFPRGFYWDEGFHLQLIGLWDNDLSLEIIKSWVDLIDEDGWVAREQILGEEARSKVPKEFWVQYPHYANPPTLAIAVTTFIDRLKKAQGELSDADLSMDARANVNIGSLSFLAPESVATQHLENKALAAEYLRSIYPKLRKHYLWFKQSQKGQISEWGRRATSRSEAYRWRGRSETHVLTSGLDDYPRARPPHIGELHLDLACWVAFFSRTMSEIAEFLNLEDDLEEYQHAYDGVLANLEDLHWNEEEKMYCDVSVDGDDESYFVCHRGYITLFPFLLQLLDSKSDRLGSLLDIVQDPNHLWSDFGILSLSKRDPYFGQDENYWRGPIWVHMNYLALQALYNKYAKQPGPYQKQSQQIYSQLRSNLIKNVESEFQRTGFVWEQYNAENGQGQRSRPFTGWSALVTNIMAEIY